MSYQQPSGIPSPQETRPDQIYGQYSLSDFIQENQTLLIGLLIIIAIVVFYAFYKKQQREKQSEE